MRGLHSALLDPVLRDQMKRRSIEQVAKFSWESSVRQLLKTYRVAVGVCSPNTPISSSAPAEPAAKPFAMLGSSGLYSFPSRESFVLV